MKKTIIKNTVMKEMMMTTTRKENIKEKEGF
jgi:hypothetical protein